MSEASDILIIGGIAIAGVAAYYFITQTSKSSPSPPSSPSPSYSPSLSISPSETSYLTDGTITATGTGFAPNSTIYFTVSFGILGTYPIKVTAMTNGNGNFTEQFEYSGFGLIIDTYTGYITMTATDSLGDSASASWYNIGAITI